ncbi:Sulfotransferase family protein [Aquimixticola soesokkakensis]|uniref:Sulfotransferase family protein n=1 Tax=Aquimixticola soesokkakensis TaxID=1519096 RepID=A0A1Y5RE15_9RHOB|nr:sulfotransferase family 2 domain-containing protein [Aquimixticola soesokkakensis]SLN15252.1 Sulfotransferase family protein [Aquimixticola soesokkakensis]
MTNIEHIWAEHLRDAPVTAQSAEMIFKTMMRRDPQTDFIAYVLAENFTVERLETMLRDSPEYLSQGRVMTDSSIHGTAARLIYMPAARLVYCPIAKVANTSIKTWALRLNGIDAKSSDNVHMILDNGQVKLQSRFWSYAFKTTLEEESTWDHVALLRDPYERLVSCYCDKFGRTRNHPMTVKFHTAPVYRYFNGGKEPNAAFVERGITFRQFCQYINHTKRDVQDSHWAPQWTYLQNARFNKLFAIENIGDFEKYVLKRLPKEMRHIRLSAENVAQKQHQNVTKDLSDVRPVDWLEQGNPPAEAFLTPDIRQFIENYYSLDFDLYEKARATKI